MAITAREYNADDLTFLKDLLGDVLTDTNFLEPAPTVIQVQKYIGAIKACKHKQEHFLALKQDAQRFYDNKMTMCDNQIERLEVLIQAQLNEIKLNSLATPSGTVMLRHTTKKTWPAADVLLAWVKERFPQAIFTETVETVIKKDLTKLLEETGEICPGYSEEEVVSLGIRG
jgi:hypothetical protein